MSDLFVVLNFYLHFGFVWQIVKCTAQRLKKKKKKKRPGYELRVALFMMKTFISIKQP